MKAPSFEAQREEWRRIPVDDVGYLDARDLLGMEEAEYRQLVAKAHMNRFTGWRNPIEPGDPGEDGRWVELLGLNLRGRSVLDFGCGLGLDATWMALEGNQITLADVNAETLFVATRTMQITGRHPHGALMVEGTWPYFPNPAYPVDTFYASGVLHHIPYAADIIRRAAELVGPGGDIRAMLYGRAAWEDHGQDEARFLRAMDAVGGYATWYDEEKIVREWGEHARLQYLTPITLDGGYVAAHLTAR